VHRQHEAVRREFPPDKTVERAIDGLHKNEGVWRKKLDEYLGAELCRRWRVRPDASPAEVRTVVVARLAAVLEHFGDRTLTGVVWAAYNVGLPRDEASKKLDGRFRRLDSGRTKFDGLRKLFTEQLAESVGHPLPPLTPAELRAAADLLAESTECGKPHPVEVFVDPVGFVLSRFSEERVCVPMVGDAPLVASLGDGGDWCCVFTSDALLDSYRAIVGELWSQVRWRSGRQVVQDAVRRPVPAGVLVNPSGVLGAGTERSLSLPPAAARALAGF
jgi:hypothetical protein